MTNLASIAIGAVLALLLWSPTAAGLWAPLEVTFEPDRTELRGIPVEAYGDFWNEISGGAPWVRAKELGYEDFRGEVSEDDLEYMESSGFFFQRTLDLDGDGTLEEAFVGVYETTEGKEGRFVAVLKEGELVSVESHWMDGASFSTLRLWHNRLIWSHCGFCDESYVLVPRAAGYHWHLLETYRSYWLGAPEDIVENPPFARPGVHLFNVPRIADEFEGDWKAAPRELGPAAEEMGLATCADLFAVMAEPAAYDRLLAAAGSRMDDMCVIGALLERARPAERSFFAQPIDPSTVPIEEWHNYPIADVFARLDLTSLCAARRFAPRALRLIDLEDADPDVRWYHIEVMSRPVHLYLALYAGADWTGDGVEDFLVLYDITHRRTDESHGDILVLTTDGVNAPIRALDGLDLLRGGDGRCKTDASETELAAATENEPNVSAQHGRDDAEAEQGGRLRIGGIRLFPSWWSKRLIESHDWRAAEIPLIDAGGWATTACAGVLALLDAPADLRAVQLRRSYGRAVPCFVGALLERARTPERIVISETDPASDVAARLNVLSFCSSLRWRYAARDALVLAEMENARVFPGVSGVNFEQGDRRYGFDFIAGADWTADGIEDLLVVFDDDFDAENFPPYAVLVLTTDGPDAPIRALDGVDLLLGGDGLCEDAGG